ncbi:XRE family transcriptional regulator [Brevundimonas vesicularis]|uniref:XRE family transcriptional regulator n=2 Tax=Brevundimonas vesicularis TaxID=41276 RepID=A0A1Z3U5M9_BREVE|nr:XRE family transcriptional regulator [Brevundimonas vesicularis]
MTMNMRPTHIMRQAHYASDALTAVGSMLQNMHMTTSGPGHFLKQWRQHAGLSQQAACEAAIALMEDRVVAEGEEVDIKRLGLTQGNLARIENGKTPYNQRLLEILAEVYRTDVASLIMRNPEDPEGIWSIYDQIPASQRPVALKMLSGLKTGTEG